MIFWILIAAVSALVVIAITRPLLARTDAAAAGPDSEAAIYAAQLAELEREAALSGMSQTDLDAAKAELGRRLLRAAKAAPAGAISAPPNTKMPTGIAIALALILPGSAMAIYLALGSPDAPSQSWEQRDAAKKERTQYETLVSGLETALQSGKGDAQGWRLLAQAYRNLGDDAKALDALKRALQWHDTRKLEMPGDLAAALGSGLIAEAQGTVTVAALRMLNQTLKADPENSAAKFYLGLERAQKGDATGARSFWTPLLDKLPPDSPQRADLKKRIAALPK
jgi:cytochrome c-type biogenesis protein CcmH